MGAPLDMVVELFILLLAGIVLVLASRKLGAGDLPGYLVAGVAIGPWGLSLIRESTTINGIFWGSAGCVFFLAGLRLRYQRLQPWRDLLMPAAGQMLLMIVSVSLLAVTLGDPLYTGISLGILLALSMNQRREGIALEVGAAEYARFPQTVRIESFHLIAAVVFLTALPAIGPGNPLLADPDIYYPISVMIVTVAVLAGLGLLFDQACRLFGWLGCPQLIQPLILLLICGVLLLTHAASVSLLTGVFLAGVVLGNSEHVDSVTTLLSPFAPLATGLYLIACGMKVDIGIVLQHPSEILGMLIILLIFRFGWWYLVLWRSGLRVSERVLFSTEHCIASELVFVLVISAQLYYVFSAKLAGMLMVVLLLSMIVSPLLRQMVFRRLAQAVGERTETDSSEHGPATEVIIVGHGRVGQVISRMMAAASVPFAVIDRNEATLTPVRGIYPRVVLGNGQRADVLRQAGAEQARVLVLALADPQVTAITLSVALREFPHLKTVVRVRDRQDWRKSRHLGASRLHRETFESSVLAGEDVLHLLGLEFDEVERQSEAFRDHDERLLEKQYRQWIEQGTSVYLQDPTDLRDIVNEDRDQWHLVRRIGRKS